MRARPAAKSIRLPGRPSRRSAARGRRRQGMTVLVVLLLLSVTLGLSYAIVRSQTAALQIQHNADLRVAAREAAITGLHVAIKKMHTNQWCYGEGVETRLSGSLGDSGAYEVTYTTGDASIDADDPDSAMELACRVTVLSTGSAADPGDPARRATHQARAVVRLVPRALDDEGPPQWTEMTEKHTLYQWSDGPFRVNVPFRIEGPVYVQKALELARARRWYPWYPWSSDAREDYLVGLQEMRSAGSGDLRPLTGPIDLPRGPQESGLISLLRAMDVDVNKTRPEEVAGWRHPGRVSTYRIYPGGKQYRADALGWSQRGVAWRPNGERNPLGIYYRSGTIRLFDDVTIEGTLIVERGSSGDAHVQGAEVHLRPHNLPPLYGSDRPIRLPVAIIEDNFRIHEQARVSVTGLLTVGNDFEIRQARQDAIEMTIEGAVVARNVLIRPRREWYHEKDAAWWQAEHEAFLDQQKGPKPSSGIPYFPVWLARNCGLDSTGHLVIRPEPREPGEPAPRYHWKNRYDAIYVPHEDDDGLRWEVLEWTDNP